MKAVLQKYILTGFLVAIMGLNASSQETLQLALLKYKGGGDWYANPTSLTNLATFCNDNLGTDFKAGYATIEAGSADLFNYPFAHMTGHGNVVFSADDAENIRTWLIGGGFLHIDDNYGMDPFVRPAIKSVFPDLDFVELPFNHPIFSQFASFPKGLPKVHEHDDSAPQAFGLFWEGRMVCLYTYECDLGDGWEDPEVHDDPPEIRKRALEMGANIIQFVFGAME